MTTMRLMGKEKNQMSEAQIFTALAPTRHFRRPEITRQKATQLENNCSRRKQSHTKAK